MAFQIADDLVRQQQEALGADNKWHCSKFYGREITDPDVLLSYYIKHGGASYFRQCNPPKPLPPTPAKS